MTNPNPSKPISSSQPNPSLNELVGIKSELKKLNQKLVDLEKQSIKSTSSKIKFSFKNLSKLELILLFFGSGILILLVVLTIYNSKINSNIIDSLAPSQYEYKVVSPSDITLSEEMNTEGQNGWQVVSCRRAQDSLEKFSYECIMIREK